MKYLYNEARNVQNGILKTTAKKVSLGNFA